MIPDGLQVGDRLELTARLDDPYTPLKMGDKGTVTGGSDGSYPAIWMKWDNGSTLNLIPGTDRYRKVDA